MAHSFKGSLTEATNHRHIIPYTKTHSYVPSCWDNIPNDFSEEQFQSRMYFEMPKPLLKKKTKEIRRRNNILREFPIHCLMVKQSEGSNVHLNSSILGIIGSAIRRID